jgi:hypothetical protein
MICRFNQKDHPFRMAADGSRIVHAATSCSGRGRYITACGHWPEIYYGWRRLDKSTQITCKNCQRALGFDSKEATPKRYVIYDGNTRLFYKRKKEGASDWVQEIYEATRWKSKEGAEEVTHTIVHHRFLSAPRYNPKSDYEEFSCYKDSCKNKVRVRPVELNVELLD